MKQDLYSYEWISAEIQSAEMNPKANREEKFFIVSLKTMFENLNLVKRYEKTIRLFLCLVYRINIGGASFLLASIFIKVVYSFECQRLFSLHIWRLKKLCYYVLPFPLFIRPFVRPFVSPYVRN